MSKLSDRFKNHFEIEEAPGGLLSQLRALENELAVVKAERDAALTEIVALGDWTQIEARVQAARLAALRECLALARQGTPVATCKAVSALIDSEESKVSK